jgi:hypothetical protein
VAAYHRAPRAAASLSQQASAVVAQTQQLRAQLHLSLGGGLLVALDPEQSGLNSQLILAVLVHSMGLPLVDFALSAVTYNLRRLASLLRGQPELEARLGWPRRESESRPQFGPYSPAAYGAWTRKKRSCGFESGRDLVAVLPD